MTFPEHENTINRRVIIQNEQITVLNILLKNIAGWITIYPLIHVSV